MGLIVVVVVVVSCDSVKHYSLLFTAENVAANQSVISISDDEDKENSVMYVGTSNAADEKEELSGYLAGADSSVSSISFDDTPPDYTEYLRLLYSGYGRLIPDESMRPPPRDSDSK